MFVTAVNYTVRNMLVAVGRGCVRERLAVSDQAPSLRFYIDADNSKSETILLTELSAHRRNRGDKATHRDHAVSDIDDVVVLEVTRGIFSSATFVPSRLIHHIPLVTVSL